MLHMGRKLTSCKGTRTWPNGDRYAGNFKHGMQEGEADLSICSAARLRVHGTELAVVRAPSKALRRDGCTADSGSRIGCASPAHGPGSKLHTRGYFRTLGITWDSC